MSDDRRRTSDSTIEGISYSIGRLEAQMEEGNHQRTAMFAMIGEVRDGMREVVGLAETVKTHGDEIEKFKALKWKLGGAAAVVGAGGAAGVWATVKKMFEFPVWGGP